MPSPLQTDAKKKKPRGRPVRPGEVLNPTGISRKVEEPDAGEVTSEMMRKVLGQGKSSDTGPTEKALRRWLDKDTKGFLQEIDRREESEARGSSPGEAAADGGVERVRALIAELRADLKRGGT